MPWPISDLPITTVTVSSGATRTKALGASVRPASPGAAASRRFAKRMPRTRPPPMTPAAIPAMRKVRRSKPAGD